MRTAVFCAALAALAPTGAGAQSLNLTEAEALARFSADSPRARAARAGVEMARADVLNAGRWPNPRLTVDRESVAGVTEHMVMVAQPLPISGRRSLQVQAAQAMVGASESRAEEDIRRLRADLRLAFADLIASQVRERALAIAEDRLRNLTALLEKRETAGDSAGFDRLRAERELIDVDADRVLAATDRAAAQAALAGFFIDVPNPSAIVGVAQPHAPTDLPPVETLVQRAESTRGALVALRREAEAAEFARRAADRQRIPEPEMVAGTKSSSLNGGEIGSVFTVHATIPLFDRGQPEHALAVARASEANVRASVLAATTRAEIAALRTTVLERRAVAERYRANALKSTDEVERIAQVSYDAGERGILELLDAYRTGAAARVRQAVLDAAVRQAEIELEFVSGWEMR